MATASSAPNKQHPTGAQTLAAVARELGSRVRAEEGALAGLPAPERSWGGGGVHLLDYGARYSHTGLMAAGFLIQRKPGSTVTCCS